MVPKGMPQITKKHKKSKKEGAEDHLNAIPQKTLKIADLGRVWDLQNRAETQARASFSLIRLGMQKWPQWFQKAYVLEALGTLKS